MPYLRKGRPFSGDIPELQDPRWEKWTRPLLDFLDQPRTWKELKAWGRENKVDGHYLRHQLAWLEDRKLAASKPPRERRGSWIWFNSKVRKRKRKPYGRKMDLPIEQVLDPAQKVTDGGDDGRRRSRHSELRVSEGNRHGDLGNPREG